MFPLCLPTLRSSITPIPFSPTSPPVTPYPSCIPLFFPPFSSLPPPRIPTSFSHSIPPHHPTSLPRLPSPSAPSAPRGCPLPGRHSAGRRGHWRCDADPGRLQPGREGATEPAVGRGWHGASVAASRASAGTSAQDDCGAQRWPAAGSASPHPAPHLRRGKGGHHPGANEDPSRLPAAQPPSPYLSICSRTCRPHSCCLGKGAKRRWRGPRGTHGPRGSSRSSRL